jgi:hypothetical protein
MTVEYSSYLIRLWREIDAGHTSAGEWQGEVEHIQSGRCWSLQCVEALVDMITAQTKRPQDVGGLPGPDPGGRSPGTNPG